MGGRQKGTLGRNKERLMKTLQAEYGIHFNPIMKAAAVAMDMAAKLEGMGDQAEISDYKATADTWMKIGEWTNPKIKAVEEVINEEGEVEQLGDAEAVARLVVILNAARERASQSDNIEQDGSLGTASRTTE